ncbi:MAG: hypothetical protein ACOX7R_13115 [Acetivibrionales bacterium]|jgi:hypothetical protein
MYLKKIVIGGVLILTLAIQIGCYGNNSQKNPDSSKDVNQKVTENSEINHDSKQEKGIMDEFNSLVDNRAGLNEIINFINENILLVSKENASAMVCRFEEVQENNLPELEKKYYADSIQEKLNDAYKPGYIIDINEIDSIDDKELKDLLVKTRDVGFKVETAEGMFFPIINYEFYKKYSSYVMEDIKEYIDIMAVESGKAPARDAALVIGWDEVLDRALIQEKFINQYTESERINDIRQLYEKYVRFALFGLNNTPLFNYDSLTMSDEAKSIYLEAVEKQEESKLMEKLQGFIEILEKSNYRLTDEASEYRETVLENM